MNETLAAAAILLIGIATPNAGPPPEDRLVGESVECLAKNMYYEARSQGTAGQLAVSAVVLNRVNDSRFPNSVCEVIFQGPTKESWRKNGTFYPIRNKCQFSWYCDGLSDEPKNDKVWKKVLDLSKLIMHNSIQFVDITDGATHYHADYVKPDWAKTKTRTTEIGDHIFYKWEKK